MVRVTLKQLCKKTETGLLFCTLPDTQDTARAQSVCTK